MIAATNVAASVKQRLLNVAHKRNEDFGFTLSRYAIERLLYRVAVSPMQRSFILKGATLFTVWSGVPHRATRDLDLLDLGFSSPEILARTFRELCAIETTPDGLLFDEASVRAAPIREDNIYGGIRITLVAKLGTTRIPVQVDVGFGDDIVPAPEDVTLPTLLDFSAPALRAYPKETVIAEKFHAMVVVGMTNSRMKDFFDIAWLAEKFAFNDAPLRTAITATFARRRTSLPEGMPLALTVEFYGDDAKQQQWKGFLRRVNLPSVTLATVVGRIANFLAPFVNKTHMHRHWPCGGPWGDNLP